MMSSFNVIGLAEHRLQKGKPVPSKREGSESDADSERD